MLDNSLNPDRLLSRSEVQSLINISQRYLELAAVKGGGPPMIKIGRKVSYRVSDLRSWLDSKRVQSTSDMGGQNG